MRVRSTFVLLLLFMWTVAPTLRCLVPDEVLTPEGQACCQHMGGDCGDMGNHSCCNKVEHASPAVPTAKAANTVQFVALGIPLGISAATSQPSFIANTEASVSPPTPTSSSSPILRI